MPPVRSVPGSARVRSLTAAPTRLPAGQIAALVASGELSAEEVVAAHLQRIADIDPTLHAMVGLDVDGAVRAARRIDSDRRRDRRLGPLAGVPFVVKDNIDVRGTTTSCGSRAHAGVVALRNSTVVMRLVEAGAILLGRTNMDELAMGASTQTSAFGATHNPWDVRRSPGGSSGGSAAAVAAGLAPLSIGTDTGGSIREPAAQCGVVGLAPTPGLVPMRGVVPFAPDLDRVGPLARSVGDVARLLAVLAARPELAGAARPSRRVRRLRVGLVAEHTGSANHPAVLARLALARDALAELGIEVVPVSLPAAPDALAAYMAITSAACVGPLARYVRTGQAGAEVVRRVEIGRALLAAETTELAEALAVRQRLVEQTASALTRCDVLFSPTMPTTAPLLTDEATDRPAVTAAELADPMVAPYTDCWTVVANLTRLPSLSVPAGRSAADGMPVAMMLCGRPGSDADLLAVGGALERHGLADR